MFPGRSHYCTAASAWRDPRAEPGKSQMRIHAEAPRNEDQLRRRPQNSANEEIRQCGFPGRAQNDPGAGMNPAVRDLWIATEKGTLFARSWEPSGEPSNRGEAILLFHDSLGCVEVWRDFPAQLAVATGRPVVSYDRLGFGRSDAQEGRWHSVLFATRQRTSCHVFWRCWGSPGSFRSDIAWGERWRWRRRRNFPAGVPPLSLSRHRVLLKTAPSQAFAPVKLTSSGRIGSTGWCDITGPRLVGFWMHGPRPGWRPTSPDGTSTVNCGVSPARRLRCTATRTSTVQSNILSGLRGSPRGHRER